MKTKLTEPEADEIELHARGVIETGHPWEDKVMHHPAGAIIHAVLAIKGMEKREDDDSIGGEGFTTNGWQYDWWQNFTHEGKNYTLSGSGFYGGHGFHLSDE